MSHVMRGFIAQKRVEPAAALRIILNRPGRRECFVTELIESL